MKNLIRNILKEELNTEDRFLKIIDNEGLLMVCRKVGGIKVLSKITKVSVLNLLKREFKGKTLDTNNLIIPINAGGYDFRFKIKEIIYYDNNDLFLIGIEIINGYVTLIMTTDETYDLLSDETKNLGEYWEIKNEIKDIVHEFFVRFLKQIKYKSFVKVNLIE
jgi:hypothetical protein